MGNKEPDMDATLRQTRRNVETARDMVTLAARTARADHRAALTLLADAQSALTRECCAMRQQAIQKAKDSYKGCPECHGTGTVMFRGQVRHCPRSVGKLCTPAKRKKAGSVDDLVKKALNEVEPKIRTHRHEVQSLMDEVRTWITG